MSVRGIPEQDKPENQSDADFETEPQKDQVNSGDPTTGRRPAATKEDTGDEGGNKRPSSSK